MKKGFMVLCLAMIIAIGALAAGCGEESTKLPDCFDEETVKEEAKAAIKLAESDNYKEFIKLFNDQVVGTLTEESYQTQYLAVVKEKGEFESFGKEVIIGQTDEDTGANYAASIVVANYTDGQIQYSVGFDEDMKLVQFMIK